jgi:hypothetical protein
MRIPYKKPLYWKWMWSMMNKPGERKMARAAAWAVCFAVDVCMNLKLI